MAEEEKGEKRFRVSDRRRFTEGGDKKDEPERKTAEAAQPTSGDAKGAPAGESEGARAGKEQGPTQLPEINFSTFVFSLSSSAFIHLGLAEDPMTGEKRKDLPLAKQTIDILAMLQEKTRGNLSEDEGKLMEGILYELRMRYVDEKKK